MDEQKIITLTDREKCRLRMPVFFGSFDSRDMTFIETLMNARDELVNHCEWDGGINVTLSDDCLTLSVEDNGRGIPLSSKDENGEYNYIKLFETLFSGCNFENSFSDSNIETIGQNGVGATCTAYNSLYYQAIEYRDNIAREVTYTDGCLNREYREYKSDKKHGTKITFKLDNTTFTNVRFNPEYIRNYINKISSTTTNITYSFSYVENTEKFKYENVREYFDSMIDSQISNIVDFNEKTYEIDGEKEGKKFTEKDRIKVMLSLSTDPIQETYLNGGYLEENGTLYIGIIDGIRKYFQKHLDKKTKLTSQDIEMSFNIYGNMGSNNPVYSNQTKKAASNELYKKIASDYIIENMEIYKAENNQEFEKILNHIKQINSFNTRNENSIKNIKKKLSESMSICNRINKFVDCRTKDKSKRELYIVEGDSALGACKQGRNSEFQGLMPIRGKILNCLKADYDKIFKSDIIVDLLKLCGCGIEVKSKHNKDLHTFDIDNLQWNKIIICTDQDVDGLQIRTLILTMFYRLAPSLIEQGKIYIVESPLYEISKGDIIKFAYSDKEKDDIVLELGNCHIQRSKGLGENDADMMWNTTMNPDTRKLIQITMDDIIGVSDKFELLLGDNLVGRKSHITDNFDKYLEVL